MQNLFPLQNSLLTAESLETTEAIPDVDACYVVRKTNRDF